MFYVYTVTFLTSSHLNMLACLVRYYQLILLLFIEDEEETRMEELFSTSFQEKEEEERIKAELGKQTSLTELILNGNNKQDVVQGMYIVNQGACVYRVLCMCFVVECNAVGGNLYQSIGL